MNIEKEKERIIESLQSRNEEWLIEAIKKLLQIEPETFSEEHKVILMERLDAYEKHPTNVLSFEGLKETFRKEGKWL